MHDKKEIIFHGGIGLPQNRRTQSFSSYLLEAIYQSMDDEFLPCNGVLSHKMGASVSPIRERSILLDLDDKRVATVLRGQRQSGGTSSTRSSNSSEDHMFSFSSEDCCHFQEPAEQREEENFKGKTLSRMKLQNSESYGEAKKTKQPSSPRGRISHFLNHIFSLRKEKTSSTQAKGDAVGNRSCISYTSFRPKFSLSSVPSFTKSCLFKPHLPSVSDMPDTFGMTIDRRVSKLRARELTNMEDPKFLLVATRDDKKKLLLDKETKVCGSGVECSGYLDYKSGEEDDDSLSCSSSQLFELDHLIGDGSYREQLPVHETTKFS